MKILTIILILFQQFAYANKLCEQIQDSEYDIIDKIIDISDLVSIKYAPSKLIEPQELLPQSKFKVETKQGKRNIIFLFMPIRKKSITSEEIKEYQKYKDDKIILENEYNKYISYLKKVSGKKCIKRRYNIYYKRRVCLQREDKLTAIERCKEANLKSNYFKNKFSIILSRQKKYTNIQNYYDSMEAIQVIKNTNLKLNWEVIKSTNLEEVHKILNSKKIRNVVFVNHASKSGSLKDSNGYEIRSKTFLRSFSPSLESISFYSCYAHKIPVALGLDKKFENLRIYPRVFTPKKRIVIGKEGLNPINGLSSFLEKIENKIINDNRIILQNIMFAHNKCQVKVPDYKVLGGAIEISLNNYFLGTISTNHNKVIFEFSCDILNKRNLLYITQLQGNTKVRKNTMVGEIELDSIKNITIQNQGPIYIKDIFLSHKYLIHLSNYN